MDMNVNSQVSMKLPYLNDVLEKCNHVEIEELKAEDLGLLGLIKKLAIKAKGLNGSSDELVDSIDIIHKMAKEKESE